MQIETLLKEQGWELIPRNDWIAIQDHRPAFGKVFPKARVGKVVETTFYVTLIPLPSSIRTLIEETGAAPVYLKSRNAQRGVEYMGFDTSTVSDEKRRIFVKNLSTAIDDLL